MQRSVIVEGKLLVWTGPSRKANNTVEDHHLHVTFGVQVRGIQLAIGSDCCKDPHA